MVKSRLRALTGGTMIWFFREINAKQGYRRYLFWCILSVLWLLWIIFRGLREAPALLWNKIDQWNYKSVNKKQYIPNKYLLYGLSVVKTGHDHQPCRWLALLGSFARWAYCSPNLSAACGNCHATIETVKFRDRIDSLSFIVREVAPFSLCPDNYTVQG